MREPQAHPTYDTIERYCVIDKARIPAKRLARKSVYCSDECRRIDRIEKRRLIAETRCRLCKRPKTSKSKAKTAAA